jgi:TolB-like protein/Tfp pilus assembly protein PilF
VRAFSGETVGTLVEAILHRRPPPPSSRVPTLSPEFDHFIARALEKEPERRFADADEMNHALAAVVSGSGSTTITSPGAAGRRSRESRRRAILVAVGAVILAGVLAFSLRGTPSLFHRFDSTPGLRGIAILPLQNLSGDPAEDFFAAGMTEAITTQLAQVGSLRVISAGSSAAAVKAGKGPREIARRIGVDALVEGSVARSPGRIRVTAKLVDALHERYVWAQSYERESGDVIALQGELALAIAQQVRIHLSPGDSSRLSGGGPVRPEAYEAYLRGRYFWNRRSKEGIEKSVGYFQRAIEIDPRYAAAHAGLADAYAVYDLYTGARPTWSFPRARAAALQAIALDSNLAEAHAALGRVLLHYEWNFPRAEAEFRRALELNPGYATAHQWYSIYLRDVGRSEAAIAEAAQAVSRDPLSLIINANLGDTYFYARRFDMAVAQHRETLALDSTFAPAYLYLGNALAESGRLAEGLASIERARALGEDSVYGLSALGYVAARMGDRVRARKVSASLTALHGVGRARALDVALVHAGLGEVEPAMEWLERAYAERSGLNDLAVDPRFDSIRGDSRFRGLLARVGLEPQVVAHP